MLNLRQFRARAVGGFTLVELMVVVLIITILTVIAVPSYTNYVRKSRRTEAKTMLLDLAAREERYMATNGFYSQTATDLGVSAWPQSTASGYYTIAAPNTTAASYSTSTSAAVPATFTITATATGTQLQDTECKQFIVNNSGQQTSTNSSGTLVTDCW